MNEMQELKEFIQGTSLMIFIAIYIWVYFKLHFEYLENLDIPQYRFWDFEQYLKSNKYKLYRLLRIINIIILGLIALGILALLIWAWFL